MANTNTDGSYVVGVELDDKEAMKELNQLKREIKSLSNSIENMRIKRAPLAEQMEEYAAQLDSAKAKLAELKYMREQDAALLASGGTGQYGEYMIAYERQGELAADIAKQEAEVKKLEDAWKKVSGKVKEYDSNIAYAEEKLKKSKNAAGEMAKQVSTAEESSRKMAEAQEKVNGRLSSTSKGLGRITSRLKGMAMTALLFSGIYKAFNAMSSYLGGLITSNEEFANSLAAIKGNLLTAFQPIYEAVAPALGTLLDLVNSVTRGIAQFVSIIFGKSVKSSAEAAKNQYELSNAIESTGDAAEKAQKQLLGFDELNILQDTSVDTSGAQDTADAISASFELIEDAENESWVDKLTNSNFGKGFVQFWEKLKDTLTSSFSAIWDGVTSVLGKVIDVILNADPDAIEAVLSVILKWLGIWLGYKAVTTVIDKTKSALSAFGNLFTNHPILTAAGIIAGIVTALQELDDFRFSQSKDGQTVAYLEELRKKAVETREATQELVAQMHEDWDNVETEYGGIQEIAERFYDLSQKSTLTEGEQTLLDTYREQLEEYAPGIKEGIDEITGKWTGTKDELQAVIDKQKELYMVQAMKDDLSTLAAEIWKNQKAAQDMLEAYEFLQKEMSEMTSDAAWAEYVDSNLSGEYKKYLLRYQSEYAATLPGDRPEKLSESEYRQQLLANEELREKWTAQQYASAGYEQTYREMELLYQEYENQLKYVEELNKEFDNVSLYIANSSGEAKESAEAAGTAAGEAIKESANAVLKALAAAFGVKIPALATGSVIPPNREFLAVLGDNKQEPEVVAPLSTIRQAVDEALSARGYGGSTPTTVVLELDGKEFGRAVFPSIQRESSRLGMKLVTQ